MHEKVYKIRASQTKSLRCGVSFTLFYFCTAEAPFHSWRVSNEAMRFPISMSFLAAAPTRIPLQHETMSATDLRSAGKLPPLSASPGIETPIGGAAL